MGMTRYWVVLLISIANFAALEPLGRYAHAVNALVSQHRLDSLIERFRSGPFSRLEVSPGLRKYPVETFLRDVRIQWGGFSHTILERERGEMSSMRVSVVLDSNKPDDELLVDLSHEMVHATYIRVSDPSQIRLDEFLEQEIEGPGGEIPAVLAECDWIREETRDKSRQNECAQMSTASLRREFYSVGGYERHPLFVNIQHYKNIMLSPAVFLASKDSLPYPISLASEYFSILRQSSQSPR